VKEEGRKESEGAKKKVLARTRRTRRPRKKAKQK
jgi:hypothetical protein